GKIRFLGDRRRNNTDFLAYRRKPSPLFMEWHRIASCRSGISQRIWNVDADRNRPEELGRPGKIRNKSGTGALAARHSIRGGHFEAARCGFQGTAVHTAASAGRKWTYLTRRPGIGGS